MAKKPTEKHDHDDHDETDRNAGATPGVAPPNLDFGTTSGPTGNSPDAQRHDAPGSYRMQAGQPIGQPRTAPGNDRVVDTGRAPSGTGYPDGEPRQAIPTGAEIRTPSVSSPENPSVPRPPENRKEEGGEPLLKGVKKGDMVRLLEPHWDGVQLLPADAVVRWWNDTPPSARMAALPETPVTPLTAPVMTDGIPSADYLDPQTGKKPVIGSV